MEELAGAACAGAFCIVVYSALAVGAGSLVHLRMKKVERELGRPALPPNETAELLYAGASVVWLSAAVIALVGLLKRDWTRAGRNAFFILLIHFGLAVLAATGQMASDVLLGRGAAWPIVVAACGIVVVSAFGASAFVWRWGTQRVARIEALPPTGDPPGAERYAVYVGSVLVGMLGLIAAFIYKEPQNVRVGVTAARVSMAWMLFIVVAVCVGLSALAATLG